MAKKQSGARGQKPDSGTRDRANAIPDALREAGKKAAELAQNPMARSLFAAGLLTAATALAANKSVRDSAKRSARNAQDAAEAAAEAAAESANKIGAAMITAATDAVRRMMAGAAAATGSARDADRPAPQRAAAPTSAKAKPAKARAAPAKAAAKSAAKPGRAAAKPAGARSPKGRGSGRGKPVPTA